MFEYLRLSGFFITGCLNVHGLISGWQVHVYLLVGGFIVFTDSEGFQVLVLCIVDLFNCYSAFMFLFFMPCPKYVTSKSLAHMQSILGL